jgi:ribosomal protein L11 methyltransferase
MEYLEFKIKVTPENQIVNDVLASELADLGFESFTSTENEMQAYVPIDKYDEAATETLLSGKFFESTLKYEIQRIPDQNWNETWEKNYFQPIVIGDKCVIHSSFHTNIPQVAYDIVIDPKMAFGTGHHETTSLMLTELLELDVTGKVFLDMGCGTAVLAILASMKGAATNYGIDIDEWAVNNAIENTQLNNTRDIVILTGDSSLLADKAGIPDFDIIFANINRNILLQDMSTYVSRMRLGASLFMSGFYESDLHAIRENAESLGLTYCHHHTKNNWVAVCFVLS